MSDPMPSAPVTADHERRLATVESRFEWLVPTLATREDLMTLRSETREEFSKLRDEIAQLRSENREEFSKVRGEIEQLRSENREEFARVRGESRDEFARVRNEFKELKVDVFKAINDQTWKLVGMSAVLVAATAFVTRYSSH